MKKIYIKSKKHFTLLLSLLSVIIFIVINVILINRYGMTTVSAYGFLLTVFICVISIVALFVVLIICAICHLIKRAIGIK